MALIKCKECGKEISDKATTCIHCGCPIEKKSKTNEKELKFFSPKKIKRKVKEIESKSSGEDIFTTSLLIFSAIFIGCLLPALFIPGGLLVSIIVSLICSILFIVKSLKNNKRFDEQYNQKIAELCNDDIYERAEKRKKDLLNSFQEKEENDKKQEKIDFDEWKEKVKKNKIYKSKEFIPVAKEGFLWYEDNNYYFYIINTKKEYFNLGYFDGIIKSNKIRVYEKTHVELVNHNNKLKGAIAGGIVAGTTGAIIGSNVENTSEKSLSSDGYCLEIDKAEINIDIDDYIFLTKYIDMNNHHSN